MPIPVPVELTIVPSDHDIELNTCYSALDSVGGYRFFLKTNMGIVLHYTAPAENYLSMRQSISQAYSGMTIYPIVGSREFNQLVTYYDQEGPVEETSPMPDNAAPSPYAFVIRYDKDNDNFFMTPPVEQNRYTAWQPESFSCSEAGLANAYRQSLSYARQTRETCGGTWHVYPRRNSTAYNTLTRIARGEKPNTSGIETFSQLRAKVKHIVNNITTLGIEEDIMQLVKYVQHKKALRYIATSAAFVIDFLDKLKVKDLVICNGDYVIAHASNTIQAYVTGDKSASATFAKYKMSSSMVGQCQCCKDRFLKDHITTLRDVGKTLCEECLDEEGYYRCGSCIGRPFHNRAIGCPTVTSNRKPLEYIYPYSYDVTRVIPQLFSTKKKPEGSKALRYGVELEVVKRSDVKIQHAAYYAGGALYKYAILKSDSSIGSDGFEIVTSPATLNFHRETLWKDFFSTEDSDGKTPAQYVYSWNTQVCGLHIHITRAALTKMQLSKLLVFYHEETNNAFLSKIAGRLVGPRAHYCKTAKKKLRSSTARDCEDHHGAITISSRNHGKTAEVRIFRGNATKHGIMRCLEFVDATVKWCGTNSADNLSWKVFLQWFNQPTVRATYPDLWKHLIQLGYLKTKHKSKGMSTLVLVPDDERVA